MKNAERGKEMGIPGFDRRAVNDLVVAHKGQAGADLSLLTSAATGRKKK
jgi:hypothetical protein